MYELQYGMVLRTSLENVTLAEGSTAKAELWSLVYHRYAWMTRRCCPCLVVLARYGVSTGRAHHLGSSGKYVQKRL